MNKAQTVVIVLFLLAFVLFIIVLFGHQKVQPQPIVNNIYQNTIEERVINNTIIQPVERSYQPSADCVKIGEVGSDSYTLSCTTK